MKTAVQVTPSVASEPRRSKPHAWWIYAAVLAGLAVIAVIAFGGVRPSDEVVCRNAGSFRLLMPEQTIAACRQLAERGDAHL